MWKKCCVAWKGLNIFNNRITFLSWQLYNVEILLLIWLCVGTWYLGFSIVEELLHIFPTCTSSGDLE